MRAGIRVGKLDLTWRDLWTGARGLEVSWDGRLLFVRGFGR